LERSVGVGIALEVVAVGVEDVDGVLGVLMVAGDVPEKGLEVGGRGVVVSGGAADVGIRGWSAVDDAAGGGPWIW
jgi:hypothetical protein